jgi:hypothetical protein
MGVCRPHRRHGQRLQVLTLVREAVADDVSDRGVA